MLDSILSYDIIIILNSYFWHENVRVLLYAKAELILGCGIVIITLFFAILAQNFKFPP